MPFAKVWLFLANIYQKKRRWKWKGMFYTRNNGKLIFGFPKNHPKFHWNTLKSDGVILKTWNFEDFLTKQNCIKMTWSKSVYFLTQASYFWSTSHSLQETLYIKYCCLLSKHLCFIPLIFCLPKSSLFLTSA